MSLDPKLAEALMANMPEMQAFVAHVAEESMKLESFEGLEKISIEERGHEITARMRAKEVLLAIISPLINRQTFTGGSTSKDYGVE